MSTFGVKHGYSRSFLGQKHDFVDLVLFVPKKPANFDHFEPFLAIFSHFREFS